MCATLGGSVIVAHIPELVPENLRSWHQLKRSLDQLEAFCCANAVRIAVENRPYDQFNGIHELFSENDPQFIGLCYDSGHGNIGGNGLQYLDSVKERLISVHLHDNDGLADQHKPVFTGTVDWEELARLVSESPYREFLTLETQMKSSGMDNEDLFLKRAHSDGLALQKMIWKPQDAQAGHERRERRDEPQEGAATWAALQRRRRQGTRALESAR